MSGTKTGSKEEAAITASVLRAMESQRPARGGGAPDRVSLLTSAAAQELRIAELAGGQPGTHDAFQEVAEILFPGDPDAQRRSLETLERIAPALASSWANRKGGQEVHRLATALLGTFGEEHGPRARAYRLAAAFETLAEQAERKDDSEAFAHLAAETDDATAATRLAEELRVCVETIRRSLETAGLLYEASAASPPERDRMLAWDAALADALEEHGEPVAASMLRERARERWETRTDITPGALWRLWILGVEDPLPPQEPDSFTPHAIRHLATALWRTSVGPRLEQERRKPPALVRPVYTDALLFHSRKTVDAWDPASGSLTFEGRELARVMGATIDLDVILRGLSLLGSLTAHRLFRWEVMTGYEQRMADMPNPSTLEVPGGWAGLARMLKLNPDKHATDLRAIVKAQAHFEFTFPNGARGNLLTYLETPARGQKQAHVSITLGKPLMPHYAAELMGDAKRLVPLLRQLPPLYGRPNEHGQQMTMALSIVAELRERARELAQKGCVQLTHDDFTRLADRSGLPRQLIVPVRDHWIAGDAKAPAFLALRGGDRYTLADAHRAERDFIEEGGRFELQGAALGARSVVAKRRKLERIEQQGSRSKKAARSRQKR